MIDTYHNSRSLDCEKKIKECLEYYHSKNFEEYDDIYEEYDRINSRSLKLIPMRRIYFSRGKSEKSEKRELNLGLNL